MNSAERVINLYRSLYKKFFTVPHALTRLVIDRKKVYYRENPGLQSFAILVQS